MIRLAVPEDFTSIMSIYAYARSFMQETGNPNQWGNHFPPEELIHNRIRDKQLFVLEENGTLHGAFAFIIGEDPTYLQIDDGSWLSDAPYGTIHQVASDGTIHGFFSQIVDYCWAQIPHLPRYLKAMVLRAERAKRDPARDQARMLELKPFLDALQEAAAGGRSASPRHAQP